MKIDLRRLIAVLALLSLGACVVYEPSVQERYDRSWYAATGAMSDQGVTITSQDRGSGVVRGERGGITIIATLQTMSDGSLQVRFDSKNDRADPGLIQRVSDSYDRRMGR